MMMRLGVWQRLGIVVTALWMVGGTLWQANEEFKGAFALINLDYTSCTSDILPNGEYIGAGIRKCSDIRDAAYDKIDKAAIWQDAIGVCALAALFFWLIVLGVIYATRWILSGRQAHIP